MPPGVDTAIAQAMSGMQLSPLVLGWVVAALLRVSVGSATVAAVTAASIMAPIVDGHARRQQGSARRRDRRRLAHRVHVNDGGFWLVKEYFNMSVPQTRRHLDGARDDRLGPGPRGVMLLGLIV